MSFTFDPEPIIVETTVEAERFDADAPTIETYRWAEDKSGQIIQETISWRYAPHDPRAVQMPEHDAVVKAGILGKDAVNLWCVDQIVNGLHDVEAAIKEATVGTTLEWVTDARGKRKLMQLPDVRPAAGSPFFAPLDAPIRDGLTLIPAADAEKKVDAQFAAAQKTANAKKAQA